LHTSPSDSHVTDGASDDAESDTSRDSGAGPSLREQVEAFERGLITRALEGAAGNQSKTARTLGVSRVTLIDKLKKYGLTGKFR
jgi:DNA-binding NtrC family response regulator